MLADMTANSHFQHLLARAGFHAPARPLPMPGPAPKPSPNAVLVAQVWDQPTGPDGPGHDVVLVASTQASAQLVAHVPPPEAPGWRVVDLYAPLGSLVAFTQSPADWPAKGAPVHASGAADQRKSILAAADRTRGIPRILVAVVEPTGAVRQGMAEEYVHALSEGPYADAVLEQQRLLTLQSARQALTRRLVYRTITRSETTLDGREQVGPQAGHSGQTKGGEALPALRPEIAVSTWTDRGRDGLQEIVARLRLALPPTQRHVLQVMENKSQAGFPLTPRDRARLQELCDRYAMPLRATSCWRWHDGAGTHRVVSTVDQHGQPHAVIVGAGAVVPNHDLAAHIAAVHAARMAGAPAAADLHAHPVSPLPLQTATSLRAQQRGEQALTAQRSVGSVSRPERGGGRKKGRTADEEASATTGHALHEPKTASEAVPDVGEAPSPFDLRAEHEPEAPLHDLPPYDVGMVDPALDFLGPPPGAGHDGPPPGFWDAPPPADVPDLDEPVDDTYRLDFHNGAPREAAAQPTRRGVPARKAPSGEREGALAPSAEHSPITRERGGRQRPVSRGGRR